jgi:hypothetical protein
MRRAGQSVFSVSQASMMGGYCRAIRRHDDVSIEDHAHQALSAFSLARRSARTSLTAVDDAEFHGVGIMVAPNPEWCTEDAGGQPLDEFRIAHAPRPRTCAGQIGVLRPDAQRTACSSFCTYTPADKRSNVYTSIEAKFRLGTIGVDSSSRRPHQHEPERSRGFPRILIAGLGHGGETIAEFSQDQFLTIRDLIVP